MTLFDLNFRYLFFDLGNFERIALYLVYRVIACQLSLSRKCEGSDTPLQSLKYLYLLKNI